MKVSQTYNAPMTDSTVPSSNATAPQGAKRLRPRTRVALAEERVATSGSGLQRLLALSRRKPKLPANKKSATRARLRARGAIAHGSGDEDDDADYEDASCERDAMGDIPHVSSGKGSGQQDSGAQQQGQQQRERQAPRPTCEHEKKRTALGRTTSLFNTNGATYRRPDTLEIAAAQVALLALLARSRGASGKERLDHAAMRIVAASLKARADLTSPPGRGHTLASVRDMLVEATTATPATSSREASLNFAQQRLHLLMPLFMLNLHTPRHAQSIDRARATLLAISDDRFPGASTDKKEIRQ